MANNVVVRIDGDTSGFESKLHSIGGIASKGLGIATKAVGAVATALVGAGAMAFKFGSEYETAMTKVSTIADTSKASMEELSDGIIDLSNKTGKSAVELSDALYQAISASVDTGDAVEFVATATKLAEGGFTSTTNAVDVLSTVLNAYGMSAEQASHVSDVLIQTQNKGKTTVDELASSIGKVIPTANAFGVSIEQLGASYSILTANGIATAESTTYLKSMLNELGKSGTKASTAFKEASGQGFAEFIKSGHSVGEAVGILKEKADASGLSLADMFGSAEAGTSAMVLASAGVDEFNSQLDGMINASGTTEDAFNKMSSTAEVSVNKIKNSFVNLGIEIYQSASGPIAEGLNLVAGYSQQLTDAFKEGGFSQLADTFGSVIGDAVSKIAEFAPTLMNSAISLLQSFIEGLNSNMDSITTGLSGVITAFVAGIGALLPQVLQLGINLIVGLANSIAQSAPTLIPQAVNSIIDLIVTALTNIDVLINAGMNLITGLVTGLVQAIPVLVSRLPEILTALVNGLASAIPMLMTIGPTIMQAIFDSIMSACEGKSFGEIAMSIINGLLDVFSSIGNAFLTIGKALLEGIVKGFQMQMHLIKTVATKIKDAIIEGLSSLLSSGIEKATEFIQGVASGISSGVGSVISAVSGFVNSAIATLSTMISQGISSARSFIQGVASGISSGVGNVISSIRSMVTNMISTLRNAISQALTIGRQIVQGIANGIRAGAEAVVNALKSVIDSAISKAKSLLGIKSPSRVFKNEVGFWIGAGIAKGIDASNGLVVKSIEKIVDNAKKIALDAVDNLYSDIEKQTLNAIGKSKYYLDDEIRDTAIHETQVFADAVLNAQNKGELKNAIEERAKYLMSVSTDENKKIETFIEKAIDDANSILDNAFKDTEARNKNIKTLQNEAVDILSNTWKEAEKRLETFSESVDKFNGNLKKQFKYTKEITKTVGGDIFGRGGFEVETYDLNDIEEYNKGLEYTFDHLAKLKNEVPSDLYEEIKTLASTDMLGANRFMNAWFNMSDAEKQKYLAEMERSQQLRGAIAGDLFKDEAIALNQDLITEFGQVPEEFFDLGDMSAERFGEGFKDKISSIMSEIKTHITNSLSLFLPLTALAGGGSMFDTSNNTTNNTYIINAGNDTTERGWIQATQDQQTYNQHVAGY